MSNALAIAAVTETLVQLLQDNLAASGVAGAHVTGLEPDGDAALPNPGVNVFLYQVTPNTAYRNADLTTRTASGSLLKKPQIALDLHYLLTFYGDDSTLEQQRLLAATALTLHANPTLPRSLIASVQASTPFLHTSTLDSQIELVRFTPIVYSLEELSKLWSFLLKVDYVLSIAYTASVVLIEADDPVPGPAPPVMAFTLVVQPYALPVIETIAAAPDPDQAIADGSVITLTGAHLAAIAPAATTVAVSGIILAPSSVADASVTVALPAGAFPAGAQSVQIVQALPLGIPPVTHPGTGAMSGAMAFILVPTIVPGSPHAVAGPAIGLSVFPQVQPNQRAALQVTAQATGATQVFDGGTVTVATTDLTIATPGVAAGVYFVRLLVDGALSPLVPQVGAPTGPLVTVP